MRRSSSPAPPIAPCRSRSQQPRQRRGAVRGFDAAPATLPCLAALGRAVPHRCFAYPACDRRVRPNRPRMRCNRATGRPRGRLREWLAHRPRSEGSESLYFRPESDGIRSLLLLPWRIYLLLQILCHYRIYARYANQNACTFSRFTINSDGSPGFRDNIESCGQPETVALSELFGRKERLKEVRLRLWIHAPARVA